MFKDFDQLILKAQSMKEKPKMIVVMANDEHSLEAAYKAYENKIVKPILIGAQKKIKEMALNKNFNLEGIKIIDEEDAIEASKKAVAMINQNEADFIMKGGLQTAILLKQVVNKETGLQTGGVMSHIALFQIPNYHKLIMITDGGMFPHPNQEQKKAILLNAVTLMNDMGIEKPKVACLAGAEVLNPKLPESVDGDYLKHLKWENCIVEGPISYDLAMSKEIAKLKGYESPVAGDADILLVPSMATGNILAKSWSVTAGGIMTGVVLGAKVPIVVPSRGATTEEKYLSIVVAAAKMAG